VAAPASKPTCLTIAIDKKAANAPTFTIPPPHDGKIADQAPGSHSLLPPLVGDTISLLQLDLATAGRPLPRAYDPLIEPILEVRLGFETGPAD
jgi:hypothetical protein